MMVTSEKKRIYMSSIVTRIVVPDGMENGLYVIADVATNALQIPH